MAQRRNQNEREFPSASLSIVLVSSVPDFCTKLRAAIFRARKLKTYPLQVHLCETIDQDIFGREIKLEMHFIVFGMDIKQTDCIQKVKKDLNLIEKTFFSLGDYCMVINPNVPSFEMGITWDSLQELQSTYQIPLIIGDTEDEDKCNYLGQRILGLVESFKGVHSGIPLSILTHDVREEETTMAARRHLTFMDV